MFGRAELANDRANQFQAENGQGRGTCQSAFFFKDVFLSGRESGAAILFRPQGRQPSFLIQDRLPLARDVRFDKHAWGGKGALA